MGKGHPCRQADQTLLCVRCQPASQHVQFLIEGKKSCTHKRDSSHNCVRARSADLDWFASVAGACLPLASAPHSLGRWALRSLLVGSSSPCHSLERHLGSCARATGPGGCPPLVQFHSSSLADAGCASPPCH